jgi:hypothetical protein
MHIELLAGETLVRHGAANLQRGAETVGGKLHLTDRRLVFQSHAFNVQTGATDIALADVEGTALRWTKLLGLVPLLPNSLAVRVRGGGEHSLVLYDRKEWQRAIEAQRLTIVTG